MKKFLLNKKMLVLLIVIAISGCTFYLVQANNVEDVEPGSEEDPLVTKSYVDEKISEIITDNNEIKMPDVLFKVVELEKSKSLIGKGGTELIIRGGEATAVQGENGDGIADISSDMPKDYFENDKVAKNHLLIISRDDGRGIKAVSDIVYILVKGDYIIKE